MQSLPIAAAALVSTVQTTASAAGSIEHIITYGQSLAAGAGSMPLISTVQRHGSLMFNGGVRTSYAVRNRASIYASLVPLVESIDGPSGETPTAGTLEMINVLRSKEDGVSYAASSVRYLGSDPAVGGLTLAQLNFGTLPFLVLTENMMYGAARARELGASYRVAAVTWTQGESDYGTGTTRAAYVAGMKTLKTQIDLYAKSFSGDATPVPIIQHQVSSHITSNATYPSIALAQLELGDTASGFYVATPSYMMEFADGLHLTAVSSKWLGAYFGVVYKRVVVDKREWKPLSPSKVTAKGSTIQAEFRVPKRPLVLDTTRVVDPGHYGFSVVTATGTEIGIRSVTLGSPDTVTIVARRPVPAGAKLRYAFKGGVSGSKTGPRGNLRDSQGDTLVFDPGGINKRMDNWCVIFESAITRPR